jgi:hypothetical protein
MELSESNESLEGNLREVVKHLQSSVESAHSRELAASRARKVNELLSNARLFMRNFHETSLRKDSETTELMNRMNSSDAKYEELRDFVSSAASDLFDLHNRTIQDVLNRFQLYSSTLQSALERETAGTKKCVREPLTKLHSVHASSKSEFLEKCDLLESLHSQKLTSLKGVGTSRRIELEAEMRIKREYLENLKSDKDRAFSEEVTPTRLVHGKLVSQLEAESQRKNGQLKSLNRLRITIDKLESRKASLETDSILKMEKEKAMEQIAYLKRQIHTETTIHEERLKHLAHLFDAAKSKIESEIRIVEQIERVWTQIQKEGVNEIRISEAADCLNCLRRGEVGLHLHSNPQHKQPE